MPPPFLFSRIVQQQTAQSIPYASNSRGLWQWCSALSLDAVLVAVVWQQWLHPTGPVPALVLGLSVWLVYCADHWLDVRCLAPHQIQTSRHRLIHRLRHSLPLLWSAVLAVNLSLALSGLSPAQFGAGCVLLAVCAGYIICTQIRRLTVPKELIVAAIFACGAVVFQIGSAPLPLLIAPCSGLFLLAFANCSLIAHKEIGTDRQMGFDSLAIQSPSSRVCAIAALFAAAVLGLALTLFSAHSGVALSLCACALLLLEHHSERLGQEAFRQMADAVLLLPVLFLLL